MSESDQRRGFAAFFKPVAGGFVYRAPSGWRLWRQRCFRVDAGLRERLLAASEEPVWALALWIAIPWIVVSADDKRRARLNVIRDLVRRIEHPEKDKEIRAAAPEGDIVFEFRESRRARLAP